MASNIPHKVTLTEDQISTILYTMEGYMVGSDYSEASQFHKDVDNIFEILETVVENYHIKVAKAKSKQPTAEWED